MSKGDRLHVQIRELHRRGTVRKSMANTHDQTGPQHWCLTRFCRELIEPWQKIARNTHQEWEVCSELLVRTDPASKLDMPLNVFAGRIDGSGRVTLSTLHSAKGREFDAVIIFGINAQDFPNCRDAKSERGMREARRLFYVGVTRPRKELCLVFQKANHSPWVTELYQRSQQL